MGDWQDRPPPPREFAGLRLTRVAKSKSITGIITCDAMIGRNTHFEHRRTVPCTGELCELCLAKNQKRWHGYVSVASTRSTTQIILELTELASQSIIEWFDRRGSLRGTKILAERKGNFDNSPVSVHLEIADVDLRALPQSPELRRFLSMLWKLPEPNGDERDSPPPIPREKKVPAANPPSESAAEEIPETAEEDYT